MDDPLGAFVPGESVSILGTHSGPLAGMTFAAKDLFDVAGTVTGCGNPDWARTHAPAQRSAWAVERLLQAGATLVGKTITDEISLGLLGINRFQGTPVNPRAPDLVAGGSSSGSASAVAGRRVDTALGTDSGGSVRTPASFTGLYGLRPTHGRISTVGMAPQAPSFDTAGFFARDPVTFAKVGAVLLDEAGQAPLPEEVLVAVDCFNDADMCVRDTLRKALPGVLDVMPKNRNIELAKEGIDHWASRQRLLQSFEFAQTFKDWIYLHNPCFSFEVASALVRAGQIPESDVVEPRKFRATLRASVDALLEERRVICLPTAPILPIRREARLDEMQAAVGRIIRLTCIAGLTGLPQVTLPLGSCGGVPVGLSLIGWRGADATLLALAGAIGQRNPS